MFIKSQLKDLLLWKSAIISSNVRHWDSYNLAELTSVGRTSTLNIKLILKQLDTVLSLLSNIFSRGGRAWFYNVFHRRKRYDINLKTMVYNQSSRPFYTAYGLILPNWFPGRLSNHRFVTLRTKLMKKKLFFHKFSALRKSLRFYKTGGSRLFIQRRRRRYSVPRWARLDRYWRPRSRSRRRGVSSKRLALYFKTFMRKRRYRRFKYRPYRYRKKKKFVKKRRIAFKKKRYIRRRKFISWIYFSSNFSSFFYKPSLGRSFRLYSKFVPVKYSKIELSKIVPGTPDNPTDLPITNMPTTSIRRKEKKKKKIFKLQFKNFNNAQGDDFRFLIKDHNSDLSSKSKLYLNFKGALFFPTARFYKLLLLRPYMATTKVLLKRYTRKLSRFMFGHKFKYRKLRYALRRTKVRNYKRRYRSQSKLFKWLDKVVTLSSKFLRLRKGAPALTFRNFFTELSDKRFLQPFSYSSRRKYRLKLSDFYKLNKKNFKHETLKFNKDFYNLEFRLFFKRTLKLRKFKLTKPKAPLGSIVVGEKLFAVNSKKLFKKLSTRGLSLKRRTLISFFLPKDKIFKNKSLNFNFNSTLLLPLRQKRLISGKYFNFRKFYKIKKSPEARIVVKSIFPVLPNVSNRKFTGLSSYKFFLPALRKSKRFKPVQSTKLPYFLRKKALKKIIFSNKNFFKLKGKIKINATPYIIYPSIIFVSRLTRLTSSVLNESRVVGVISVYFSSGEATPLSTLYNILINDRIRSLSQIEPIIRNLFFMSKASLLLKRSFVL